nr:ATP-dependent metallopeptidase FtsH/Yme1/Tma family protein [Pedobacter sp.]
MEENKNTDTKPKQNKRAPNIPKKPTKGSKFNIFWVYAAIIVGLLVLNFMFSNNDVKTVTYNDFEQNMLIPGDVKELVGYKSSDGETYTTEIYIKEAKIKDPKYKKYLSSNNLNFSKNGPIAKLVTTDAKSLQDKLAKVQENLPKEQKLDITASSKSSPWLSTFISIVLPLLLFAGLWIFMMRRMGGGGGGGGGQIFSIGKSKATLFDKESQVNITFNDVAGLEE